MASRGQYPAVDVLASLSRVAHRVSTPAHAALAAQFRRLLAVWRENEELVRLGAYKRGASPDVDEALARYPAMQRWLQQDPAERVPKATTLEQLADILG